MRITSLISFLLFPLVACAQTGTRPTTPVNVCYWEQGVVSEVFDAPIVPPDEGPAQPIDKSPIDPTRRLENLPNFGIAKWHWWRFSQMLFRAQRQYSDCIGAIRELQIQMKKKPLIDDPSSPLYQTVIAVREYEIPFEAIQNVEIESFPPRKEDAIAHALAAADTNNVTVANLAACQATLEFTRKEFRDFLRKKYGKN